MKKLAIICLALTSLISFVSISHAANVSPRVVSITPSSGSSYTSTPTSFTAIYADSNGYQDISQAKLLINASMSTQNCFQGLYDRATNKLYLYNDAGTTLVGGYAPGSSNVIENSYTKLNCAYTTVAGSGANLTVRWSVSFKPIFKGTKNTYLYVKDIAGQFVGWSAKGGWTITNAPPSLGTLTPSSGSSGPGQTTYFTTVYSDSDGYLTIDQAAILVNPSAVTKAGFCAFYNRTTNKLYLYNDAGTSFVGGYAPGSSNVIENSYARLNCVSTTISGSANALTIKWAVTFKSAFTGTKNSYLYVKDVLGATINWTKKGVWTVTLDATPPTGGVKINNDKAYTNSAITTLTIAAADNSDGAGMDKMSFSTNNVTWTSPEAYALTKSLTLPSGDGLKTVYVKFSDKLGNWSRTYSDTIILDTIAPKIVIISPTNGAIINDPAPLTVKYTSDGIQKTKQFALVTGSNIITITDSDAAGNIGTTLITVMLILPPKITSITPDSGMSGDEIVIHGENFGYGIGGDQGQVKFYNNKNASTTFWATTGIACIVPNDAETGVITITTRGGVSNGMAFTIKNLQIVNVSLSNITVGNEYDQCLSAINGTLPYKWYVESGNLPDGLSLDSSSGRISGKPKNAGTCSFLIKVTDSKMRAVTQVLSIKVSPAMSPEEQLLDDTQARAALYFYNEAIPNGFVRDGNHKDFSSIAATGFGLTSLCVMAERYGTTAGWTVTPGQAKARANQILDECIRIQGLQTPEGNEYGIAGFMYHFITAQGSCQSGSELSTIDMALFVAGAITAGEYFGGEIKYKVDQIYTKLNWSYFLIPSKKQFSHGWNGAVVLSATWDRPGDEAMLVSLMALSSDPENKAFLDTMYSWPRVERSYGGYNVVSSYFGSLFTYIFAHCYFDFEKLGSDTPLAVGSTKKPVNWWINSISAVKANRQFCMDQSVNYSSYGPDSWGVSACEYPSGGYAGLLGAAPCETNSGNPIHDGTIAPYGAISCLPFMRTSQNENLADNLAFKALKYFHDTYYNNLWGPYGPRESFNNKGEFNNYYYGLDLGSIVIMIENYKTRFVWDNFMKNERIVAATAKIFNPIVSDPSMIYVDMMNAGDPKEDGSYEHAFDTIQEGINAATIGKTVFVREGTYNEALTLNKSGIILSGDNRNSIIEWHDNNVPIISCDNIDGNETRITGFTINNTLDSGMTINCSSTVKSLKIDNNSLGGLSIALQPNASAVILNNVMPSCSISGAGDNSVRIENNNILGASYGDVHNGISLNGGTAIIKNNCISWSWNGAVRISNNVYADIEGNDISSNGGWDSAAGINVSKSNVVAHNNIFTNNRTSHSTTQAGAFNADNSAISLFNNIFVGNSAMRGGAVYLTYSNLQARNNIFTSNAGAEVVYFDGNGTQDFSYNNLWSNSEPVNTTGIVMGVGNISADPMYGAKYFLGDGSPCINAGDPDLQFIDIDGTQNDMGIYGGPMPMSDGV